MSEAYFTDTIEEHGHVYRVDYFYDSDMGAPWDEHDGHGIVSPWERRSKAPHELILNEDRFSKRFYDLKASIAKAKAEGWGVRDPKGLTPKQIIAEAVQEDFKHLKAWCNDEWHWMGVVITEIRTDSDGFTYDGFSDSLWGIASDGLDTGSVYPDLIGNIEYQRNHHKEAA